MWVGNMVVCSLYRTIGCLIPSFFCPARQHFTGLLLARLKMYRKKPFLKCPLLQRNACHFPEIAINPNIIPLCRLVIALVWNKDLDLVSCKPSIGRYICICITKFSWHTCPAWKALLLWLTLPRNLFSTIYPVFKRFCLMVLYSLKSGIKRSSLERNI